MSDDIYINIDNENLNLVETVQVEFEGQDVYIDVIQDGGNGGSIDTSAFYLKSNPSGFITGVDLSNFYTNDNPSGFITGVDLSNYTINSLTGLDLSKYNLLYTTGNQIKSGRLIIGDDAGSIVDPNSAYTLSLQTNSPATWLEILNNSGTNKGVFFGIQDNDLEQYNWQGGDIKFFTSQNPSDGTVRLTIKNDGKVGIGTNSPSEKLEVAGNIKVTNTGFFTDVIKTDSIVSIQEDGINLGPYYFNSGEGAYRPPFNTGEIVFVEHFTGSAYYNPDLFAAELEEEEVVIVSGIIDANDEIRVDPYYTGTFPSKWSDLNGTYIKTSVAVTPSVTDPTWISGLGMHTPESGTFNYYFKSYLDPGLDGVSYFLAPGNKAGWGPDPDEDALTDTPVNYWRLCSLSDHPWIYFTNPSTDPYTFPLDGWVPVDPDATPPENQGSLYLANYSGGFAISTGSYPLSGAYAFYINTFDSNGNNNYQYLSVLTGVNVLFSLEQNGNTAIYKTNSGSFGYSSFGSGIIYNDRAYEYSTALTLLKAAGTEFTSGDPIYIRIGSDNASKNFSIISGNAIFGGNLQSNTATFNNRPTVNGTGVLLSGEAAELPNTIVYTSGDQTISGIKTFASRPTVNGTGVLLSGESSNSNIGKIQNIQNSTVVALDCETYDTFVVQVSEPTTFTYANFQEGQSINIYLVSDHNGHVQHTFPTNTTFAELGDANIIYSFENYTTRILLQKIGEEIINFSSINLTPDGLFNFPAYHTMTVDFTITDIIVDVEDGAYSLYPTFDPAIKNYCAQTPNSINDQISPWSITVNGEKQSSNVNNFLRANDLVKVTDGTNSYFIRFLPNDISYITPDTPATGNYHEGYYQAAFYGASNYYYIFDKNGVPLWYYTDGTTPLSLHRGNDKNRVVTNPWVNETRGILEIKNKYITGTYYNPVNDSDGNPVDGIYMWDNHEAQELVGPPSRRGNFMGVGYVSDGFYFQEQNAAGELVWDWYSIEAFSNTNTEAYHINSVDVHPINGDIICSVRHTSSIICVDYETKNVKWVLQGDSTPYGSPLQDVARGSRTSNTKWIDGENIIGEPEYNGEQYNGTCTQHDARYHMDITPIHNANNIIISIFDDQSGGHSYSRGVIYEIDEATGIAYHRFSTFSDDENSPTVAQSPFMGSYTVLKESDNSYSHVITLVGSNISVLEYNGAIIPANDYNTADKVLALDTSSFTNNIYRFIKVPLTHFNINNLRNTAGLALNTEVGGTYQNLTVDTI